MKKLSCVAGLLALATAQSALTGLDEDFERFLEWFPAEYDNNEQVWQQKVDEVPEDERLEHIHHIFLPVEAPNIGQHTFFVRQYMDGDYENVYRQRLYSLVPDREENAIRLKIYSFHDEAKYRDTDQDPSIIRDLTPEEVRNMPGCDVFWRFEQDHFVGTMKDKACFYFSERMGQNIYITDELKLTESEIWINDEAFDEAGNRVFGRDTPHVNRKVRYFAGWAVLQKKLIDESAPEDEYLFIPGLRLHNEGQIIPLVTKEGVDTGYKVELAQLTYQNTKTRILKLAVLDKEDYAFTYIWANPEAERLVREHAGAGHLVAIVSGATKFVVRPLAERLGIPHMLYTRLEVEDGSFTGRVIEVDGGLRL